MKTFFLMSLCAVFSIFNNAETVFAQTNKPMTTTTQTVPATPATKPQTPTMPQVPQTTILPKLVEPNAADVASMDAIVKSLYSVISGDAGTKRDWNRFRSLFHPSARLIPTGKNPKSGEIGARFITPEEYIERSGAYLEKEGFHEIEIARRVEVFGDIAQVFTTYETRHKLSDAKPFMRGINSVQLLNDGKRWWILNVTWSQESPENQLPTKYLKSVEN